MIERAEINAIVEREESGLCELLYAETEIDRDTSESIARETAEFLRQKLEALTHDP